MIFDFIDDEVDLDHTQRVKLPRRGTIVRSIIEMAWEKPGGFTTWAEVVSRYEYGQLERWAGQPWTKISPIAPAFVWPNNNPRPKSWHGRPSRHHHMNVSKILKTYFTRVYETDEIDNLPDWCNEATRFIKQQPVRGLYMLRIEVQEEISLHRREGWA